MAETTRQRLIDAAGKRFYRDGFRSVGIDQILADVGISKTAFYKYYQSKDDLVLDVLNDHDRWFRDSFAAMIRKAGGEDPVHQLRAVFDVVEEIISDKDFHGCFFVNVAMEFPLPHDPAHEAAVRNKAAIEEIIRDVASRAGASDPVALAREICLLMEGAYVTRQVTGTTEAARIAKQLAERAIRDHVPPSNQAGT